MGRAGPTQHESYLNEARHGMNTKINELCLERYENLGQAGIKK